MSILSEEEALALVTVRGHCDDPGSWRRDPVHHGAWAITCGVQDERGSRHNQYIHLRVTRSQVSGNNLRFVFTLFRKTRFEQQRIFQLELICDKSDPKDRHQRSHEHIGSSRYVIAPAQKSWSFDQALAHFCKRSNIYLIPIPPEPPNLTKEKGHARKHH